MESTRGIDNAIHVEGKRSPHHDLTKGSPQPLRQQFVEGKRRLAQHNPAAPVEHGEKQQLKKVIRAVPQEDSFRLPSRKCSQFRELAFRHEGGIARPPLRGEAFHDFPLDTLRKLERVLILIHFDPMRVLPQRVLYNSLELGTHESFHRFPLLRTTEAAWP